MPVHEFMKASGLLVFLSLRRPASTFAWPVLWGSPIAMPLEFPSTSTPLNGDVARGGTRSDQFDELGNQCVNGELIIGMAVFDELPMQDIEVAFGEVDGNQFFSVLNEKSGWGFCGGEAQSVELFGEAPQ